MSEDTLARAHRDRLHAVRGLTILHIDVGATGCRVPSVTMTFEGMGAAKGFAEVLLGPHTVVSGSGNEVDSSTATVLVRVECTIKNTGRNPATLRRWWEQVVRRAERAEYWLRVWTAYHEAGHVVRAAFWGMPILTVSIEPKPNGLTRGETLRWGIPRADLSTTELLANICIALAGEAAEWRFRRGRRADVRPGTTEYLRFVATGDHRNVQAFIQLLPPDHHHFLDGWIGEHVDDWIERPEVWHAIRQVARALLKYRTLSGLRLASVLCQGRSGVRAPEEESRMNNVRRLEINARRAESIHRRAAARQVGASAASSAGTGPRRS